MAALIPLASMVVSSKTDAAFRQRSIALRAALVQLDRVMAYDYGDEFQDFITHWNQPANRNFELPELTGSAGPMPAGYAGTITLDQSDPLRIAVVVTVDYLDRGEARQVVLRQLVTEVTP